MHSSRALSPSLDLGFSGQIPSKQGSRVSLPEPARQMRPRVARPSRAPRACRAYHGHVDRRLHARQWPRQTRQHLCFGREEQAVDFHLAERVVAHHANVHAIVFRWPDRNTLSNDSCAVLGCNGEPTVLALSRRQPCNALYRCTVHIVTTVMRIPIVPHGRPNERCTDKKDKCRTKALCSIHSCLPFGGSA